MTACDWRFRKSPIRTEVTDNIITYEPMAGKDGDGQIPVNYIEASISRSPRSSSRVQSLRPGMPQLDSDGDTFTSSNKNGLISTPQLAR
jgi:hypothetical protein